MQDNVGSDSGFRDGFLSGAARALFVCAYASFCEEAHSTDNDLTDDDRATRRALPQPRAGGDWYNYAPETPPAAYALAGELWHALEIANPDGAGVYTLAEQAEQADGEAPDPEEFGRLLAMQWMGHGVSWFDDHEQFPCQIPYTEISEFSFSPEAYGVES